VTHFKYRNLARLRDAVYNKHALAVRAFIVYILDACGHQECGCYNDYIVLSHNSLE